MVGLVPPSSQCEICGKIFNQSGNLNRHRVVHTRERPFKCDVCGKGFSQKSHARTHQTVHTGVKAFECHYCNKRFSQLGHLNGHLDRHRRVEDGEIDRNDPDSPMMKGTAPDIVPATANPHVLLAAQNNGAGSPVHASATGTAATPLTIATSNAGENPGDSDAFVPGSDLKTESDMEPTVTPHLM